MKRTEKATITFCLTAISIAALAANTNPATGYELSLYQSTPLLFWVAVTSGIVFSTIGTMFSGNPRVRGVFITTALLSVMLIICIPYLRGYYYFGQEDALQHLGWSKDLILGRRIINNPYPGLHLFGTVSAIVTDLTIRRTLLISTPATYLLYCTTIPLISSQFTVVRESKVTKIGLLLGVWVAPIIGVLIPRMQPIATVTAMFIAPLAIWLSLTLLDSNQAKFAKLSFCYMIIAFALAIYHPQQLLAVLAITMMYYLLLNIPRVLAGYSLRTTVDRPLIPLFVVPSVILSYWLATRRVFVGAVTNLIGDLQGGGGGETTNPAGTGLSQVGGSSIELFVRALTVDAITGLITIVAGILALRKMWEMSEDRSWGHVLATEHGKLVLFLIALVPALAFSVVYLIAEGRSQLLRYLSLLVALGVPIVAIKLWSTRQTLEPKVWRIIVAGIIICGAVVSLPAVFASPYVYVSGHHVPEAQMDGYDWFFQNAETNPVVSMDTDIERHHRALYGEQQSSQWRSDEISGYESERGGGLVGNHFNNRQLHEQRLMNSSKSYLITSQAGRSEHIELYMGIWFNKSDFHYLNTRSEISTVFDNGDIVVRQVES